MRRALSLLLCAALLGLSWPAAAVERAAEVRVAPPAALVAPSALTVAPPLPGAGIGSVLPGENEAFRGASAASIPALPASAASPTTPSATAAFTSGPAAPDAVALENRDIKRSRNLTSASSTPASAQNPASIRPTSQPAAVCRTAGEGAAPAPDVAAAEASGGTDGARLFDGAGLAKTAAVATPVAALGAAALPLAASHLPHLSLAALQAATPQLGAVGYHFATALSVAFPLPETYAALRRGHARGFPLRRAVLGTVGGLALGLINAVMLNKASWGVMQIFVGLGILAPYVIGRLLERGQGPMKAYLRPEGVRGFKAFGHRLRRDQALWATLGVGLSLMALSAGLYAAAAAVVPGLLTAHLSAHAIADLLLWLQIGKGALFVSVFAPDAVALAHGKPTKGFSFWFTAIYFGSVAAYTIWGFTAAGMSPTGPIRDQYLALALRNAFEAVASAVSLIAIWRAARRARKP